MGCEQVWGRISHVLCNTSSHKVYTKKQKNIQNNTGNYVYNKYIKINKKLIDTLYFNSTKEKSIQIVNTSYHFL